MFGTSFFQPHSHKYYKEKEKKQQKKFQQWIFRKDIGDTDKDRKHLKNDEGQALSETDA